LGFPHADGQGPVLRRDRATTAEDLDLAAPVLAVIAAAVRGLRRSPFIRRKADDDPLRRELLIPFGRSGHGTQLSADNGPGTAARARQRSNGATGRTHKRLSGSTRRPSAQLSSSRNVARAVSPMTGVCAWLEHLASSSVSRAT